MILGHFKSQPTDHVMQFVGGKVAREGTGLSFYFLPFRTNVVVVPTQSVDAPFAFQEMTQSFQLVVLQGQFTYRIVSPHATAELLNFTVDPKTRQYLSEDPDRLRQRLTNLVQTETRRVVAGMTLQEVLKGSTAIAARVLDRIREAELAAPLGVEILSLHILAAKPAPEMAKALEAESREALLRRADEAIYARRRAAVDEERAIKESELATDTALEQQREALIALQGANVEREAEHRARATSFELEAFASSDPRTLLAVALQKLGDNAEHIGTLTITTEMLASLLNGSHDA
jgi:regulator of protease activity HflC (stomatin/prohibitin superfamily)